MTPKQRRDLVLKNRPHIRPVDLNNPKDIGIAWADYKNGGWGLPEGLNNEQFIDQFLRVISIFDSVWFAEDDNKAFSTGRGPVSLIVHKTDGWRVEPHVHHFGWARKRNKLRTLVSLFQMLRHDKEVGVCVVFAEEKDKKFFDGLERYKVLFPSGFVPNGLISGNAFVYSVKGKRRCHSSQQQPRLSEQSEAQ
jgi:hypothetical protein